MAVTHTETTSLTLYTNSSNNYNRVWATVTSNALPEFQTVFSETRLRVRVETIYGRSCIAVGQILSRLSGWGQLLLMEEVHKLGPNVNAVLYDSTLSRGCESR